MSWRGRVSTGLVLLSLVGSGPTAGSESTAVTVPIELEALTKRLGSVSGIKVPFRESRRLAILSEPIESEGVFFFAPPGDLARVTLRPARSRVVVRGDRVVFEDATGRTTFDISTHKMARGLIDNFGILLRGDLAELRRRYVLDFRATEGSWTIEMQPRAREMRMLVERIEVEGQGDHLVRMTTFESNGDQIDLFFGEAIPLSDLEPSEQREIFSIHSPILVP